MKFLQFSLLFVAVSVINASPLVSKKPSFLIDADCSKGVGYWCENIVNAKKCNAVDFCLSAVWQSHLIALDSDVICDDCKEWVGKARSFIQKKDDSGEVIKSLKWTCDLIPSKSLQHSCESLVDENVPEILKMLESTMNPDVICSKLYFCNNVNYDAALASPATQEKLLPFTCEQCNHIGSIIEDKFDRSDRDDVLEGILGVCGELSSFSDSCSTIVIKNFDSVYDALKNKITRDSLCEMSAACQNHQNHDKFNVVAPSDPNIPCELCEQLILHLRELLLTNTTEIEFKNIMDGFCHQMGQFSNECLEISDQYYKVIYEFLNKGLSANKVCVLIKICPAKGESSMPMMPLVSSEILPMPQQKQGLIEVHMTAVDSSPNLIKNGAWCTTCEYFIHYMQEALRKPSVDEDIEDLMKNVCKKLPSKIQNDCIAFVEMMGDTILSMWDQNMNAQYICPKLRICPKLSVEILSETAVDEKPTCPFCLMALQEVQDYISSNKTKQNIESALSRLCNHLSDKLVGQCTEFVKTYSDEVVEMILADFTPQEACTFIKLCTDDHKHVNSDEDFGDSNESSVTLSNPQCELCKEIVKIVEQRVINKKSKDEIRHELENSCARLRKFSKECKKFVDKYSDKIVDLIEQELEPETVCKELIFCVSNDDAEYQDYDAGLDILAIASKEPEAEITQQPQCVMCEFVMTKLEDELNDTKTDKKIENAVKTVCSKMPSSVSKSCKKFVDYYFDMIIVLIEMMKPSEVCAGMKLCPAAYDVEDMKIIEEAQNEVYKCAICKGLVEGIDTVIEDPYTDANLENLEEKLCEKFAGKYKTKCHEIANTYGLAIINLMKSLTESDEICYKLDLCSGNVTGMLKLT